MAPALANPKAIFYGAFSTRARSKSNDLPYDDREPSVSLILLANSMTNAIND
jgi:hypothetical protein